MNIFTKPIRSLLLMIFALFAFLHLHAQSPVWISKSIENTYSSSGTIYKSNIEIKAKLDRSGNSLGNKVFIAVFNVKPSTPSPADVKNYARGKLSSPTLVAKDSMVIVKDSLEYSKLISNLPVNNRYYIYIVGEGSSGSFTSVESNTKLFLFKPAKLTYFYTEYLPADYNSNSNSYPIMIFLHGAGETGNKIETLYKVDVNGPPKRVNEGTDFPFILITPQCYSSWDSRTLDTFIEELKIAYPRADLKRVYLTGLSLGGIGTWKYAVRHPDKLAAIVPISGNGDVGLGCNISKIPIWAFHDDPDSIVLTKGTTDMENKINGCAGKITPWVTLFQNKDTAGNSIAKHSIWNSAYSDTPSPSSTTTRIVIERPQSVSDTMTVYKFLLSKHRDFLGPIVNVEPDKGILSSSTTITASISHPEPTSSISSYSWLCIKRDPAAAVPTMTGSTTATLNVSNMIQGVEYSFRLTVTDSKGFIDTDEIRVTYNQPPVANAGPDKYTVLPTNSITLNGSATDVDGTALTYKWSLVKKPNSQTPTLSDVTKATLTASNLIQGDYIFKLTAYDYHGYTDEDSVLVRVYPTGGNNAPPTANAGSDISITLPVSSVSLSGSGSDSDGTISYSWSQISGPNTATVTGANTPSPQYSNLIQGNYVFRITVTDNFGATATDDLTVSVNAKAFIEWNSYDIVIQNNAAQKGIVASTDNSITATLDFYQSTNDYGVNGTTQFTKYNPGSHTDTATHVQNYWYRDSIAIYVYAGKSTKGRGSEPGEGNVLGPVGVFDLQMHPPNSNKLTVCAFKVPEDGEYFISNLGVRRVSAKGTTVKYRIFNPAKTEIKNLLATNDQDWVYDTTTINMGNLITGNLIYFAIDRDLNYSYDFSEVAWTVKKTNTSSSLRLANPELSQSNLRFYPNPAKNIIHFEGVSGKSKIMVYNSLGQRVISKNTVSEDGKLDIDLKNIRSGVYNLTIEREEKVYQYKFIKE